MTVSVGKMRRLVGNPDVYAVQNEDGSWYPVREPLDDHVLADHLAHEKTVGTYVGHRVSEATVASTMVVDIDDGNRESAMSVQTALAELGFPAWCVGVEFSGKKGYHVWLVLQDPVPNMSLRRLGRAVLALAGQPASTEVFPKQDEVRDLGNLVKLPHGVHRVTGNENPFEGTFPRPLPVETFIRLMAELPEEVKAKRPPSENRFPCLGAIQEEGCESNRNIQLFHLSAMLRRAGVSDDNVDDIVRRTNEKGDPLSDRELDTLLDSSRNGGPICGQLPEERQCGELCLLERVSGLKTRPQQLRYAAEGENVVVTVARKKGDVVEFEHDDVGKMKGVLRGR